MARSQRRTALFYDAPLSTREDIVLLKAMLLFFDDIAVFETPGYRSRGPANDPHLYGPLAERGLLVFVNPWSVMTSQTDVIIRATLHRAAIEHADYWLADAAAGAWDFDVPRLQGRIAGPPALGTGQASAPADHDPFELFKFLAQDGLLLPEDETDDWVVTPGTASVVNSVLAQAVRTTAGQQGWLIEPVATRRDEARVFTAILDRAVDHVGASNVVTSDLSAVTLNLADVGVEEILEFRGRYRSELRAYVLALHALVASAPSSQDVPERRSALVDQANRLRELQRRRWTHANETVSLGIVGAAWTLGSGDLLGAMIGVPADGSHLLPDRPTLVTAYTYLVRPDIGPAG